MQHPTTGPTKLRWLTESFVDEMTIQLSSLHNKAMSKIQGHMHPRAYNRLNHGRREMKGMQAGQSVRVNSASNPQGNGVIVNVPTKVLQQACQQFMLHGFLQLFGRRKTFANISNFQLLKPSQTYPTSTM